MKKLLLSFLSLAIFDYAGVASTVPSLKIPEQQQSVTFTENKGQVSDQFMHARPDVLFGGTANGLVYHLRNNGISYQLNSSGAENKRTQFSGIEKPVEVTIYRLDLNWIGANTDYAIKTDAALPGFASYYLPVCPGGAKNIKTYTGVTYTNIYDGIDVHYYEKEGALKYDYLVAAGADYHKIRIQVNGAKNVSLQNDGSVILKTALGDIKEAAPLVYQNGRMLVSRWGLTNTNVLSFEVSGYNAALPMVIDPITRLWGTYYGGTGSDNFQGVTTDPSGNIYGSGGSSTGTGTIIATTGAYQSTYGNANDAFVAKFNTSGVRQWATYYGGSGSDYSSGTVADASGNVFICGMTQSTLGIATTGAHQTVHGGATHYDAFLAKFDGTGALQWGTYYGGDNDEYVYGCSTDPSGNVMMTGFSSSTNATILATPGAYQTTGSGSNAYLVKFNASGVRQWGTLYGGTVCGGGSGNSCTADANGNIFICGSTFCTAVASYTTAGCQQPVIGGNTDAYLVKFNAAGVRQWATYYGGEDNEVGDGCSVDASGNVYLCGITQSTAGIATTGAYQTALNGINDAYLVKFNTSGVRQWGTYFGGPGGEGGDRTSCATDVSGNIFLTGSTGSTSGIVTAGAFQSVHGGNADLYVAQLTGAGSVLNATYYGGTGTEYEKGCATDIYGNVCVVGYTQSGSTSGIASTGAHQTTWAGNTDGMMGLFSGCVAPASPTNATGSQAACAGNAATLTAVGSGTVSWFTQASGGLAVSTTTNYSPSPALAAGVYTYYAEAATCSTSAVRTAITLTVNAIPTLTVNSGAICSGQSFTMLPSGASTYSYTGGSAVVSPATTSNYTVTGTSAAGCTNSAGVVAHVTVNINPTITVNSGSICPGTSFTMSPSGASSYTYAGGSAVVSPATNTSYAVVGSSLGCLSNTVTSTVTIYALPTVSVNSGTICSGKSFTMVPSGANTYTFSNGNAVVSPVTGTNYTVTGTSTQGCISAAVISTVSVNALPTITVNSGAICSGQSFTMVPSGASTYTFSNGNAVVTPVTGTTYTVTGTSTQGCVSAAVISTVAVNALPTLTVNSGTICAGQSFTMVPAGASTYTFSNGNAVVTPAANVTYSVTGTSAQGCVASNTAVSTVSVNALPIVSVQGASLVCSGTIISLTAQGATTYSWNTGSQLASVSVTPVITTVYTVTGISNNCSASVTKTIIVNALPLVTANASSTLVCDGSSATLNGGGALTYAWTGGVQNNTPFYPTITAAYTVTGTDANGCQGTAIATIAVQQSSPLLTVVSNPSVTCPGETATLSASGANLYNWNTGEHTAAIIITPTVTTSYTVTGTGPNGCAQPVSVTHTVILCPTGIYIQQGANAGISVYPNPGHGQFTIASTSVSEIANVEVTDITGRLVYTAGLQAALQVVDLSAFADGVYILRVLDNGHILSQQKLIKQ